MLRNALIYMLFLGVIFGCGTQPDSHSGKDYTKSMAKTITVGGTFDDKVDADVGDNTDWKRFSLEDPGPLIVNVYWDSPSKIDAVVGLYNGLGIKITEAVHKAKDGASKTTISLRNANPGAYFVRIYAKEGASVYTIEVLSGDTNSSYGVPRPE